MEEKMGNPQLEPAAKSGPLLIHWILICLILIPMAPQVRADDVKKVVYHADFADPRRFSAMLTSVNNMVTHYKDELIDYDIRIVFVAYGIRFATSDRLQGTPFQEDAELAERRENLVGRLQSLNKVHGVKLELCDITRSQIDLAEDKLYEGVTTVPSGVVELADLQEQGFAYIKIE
jgi:intracellular sulfur oxidation DsrE/DsrF family protein